MGNLINRYNKNYALNVKDLLKGEIPLWDFHIHTSFTDGKNTVEENVEAAKDQNLSRIIFTEHTEPWQATYQDWFKDYVDQINFFRKKYADSIEILIGVECPAVSFDGDLEITDDMREHCHFILGAAHRYPGMEGRRVKDLEAKEAIDLEYRTLMGLCGNHKEVDALAHIGATCSKYAGVFPSNLLRDIIKKATSNHIAIELNHWYHKPTSEFLQICAEENAFMTLGSNAHDKKHIGAVAKHLKEQYA